MKKKSNKKNGGVKELEKISGKNKNGGKKKKRQKKCKFFKQILKKNCNLFFFK